MSTPPADDRVATDRLRILWTRFRVMPFPGFRAAEEILGDSALHLVDADGYLAGLVDRYLKTGRIEGATIRFDLAGHRRDLAQLESEGTDSLAALVEYGTIVGQLAVALARSTGLPLSPHR